MIKKNKAKLNAKQNAKRKTWTGLYTRKTKTKREKEESIKNKYKNRCEK